jgi:hypothetical protein
VALPQSRLPSSVLLGMCSNTASNAMSWRKTVHSGFSILPSSSVPGGTSGAIGRYEDRKGCEQFGARVVAAQTSSTSRRTPSIAAMILKPVAR